MQTLSTLYKLTSKGQTQQWQMVVDGNTFYSIEGIKDMVLTTNKPTVVQGKNPGKKNETSGEEQALKEAQAKWQKKVDSGYTTDINAINNAPKFFKPMLADNYNDYKDKIEYPIYSNPKLDGMRCIANINGLWSRNGKEIVSVPHVFEALKPLFEKHPDLCLDGELYCDKFANDFGQIISLVRKTKPTTEDLAESKAHIEYHIYDCFLNKDDKFQERYNLIETFIDEMKSPYLKLVEATLIDSEEALTKLYEKHIADGYEGQMIRLNREYQNKRSKFLLKRKEFDDAEFEIVDIINGEGNKDGMAASALMRHPDGRTFNSNIKGNWDFLRDLIKNKDQYIGKKATIQFFGYSPESTDAKGNKTGNIPRFPYLIQKIDREEYE